MTSKRVHVEESSNTECLATSLKNVTPKLDSFVHISFKGRQVLKTAEKPDSLVDFIEAQENDVTEMREVLEKMSLLEKILWLKERILCRPTLCTFASDIVLAVCKDILRHASLDDDTVSSFTELLRTKFPFLWISALYESSSLSEEVFAELISALKIVDKTQAEILEIAGKQNLNQDPLNYRTYITLPKRPTLDESLWLNDTSLESKISYINMLLDSQSEQICAEDAQKHKDVMVEYLVIMKSIVPLIPMTDPNLSVLCKRASSARPYVIETCLGL